MTPDTPSAEKKQKWMLILKKVKQKALGKLEANMVKHRRE